MEDALLVMLKKKPKLFREVKAKWYNQMPPEYEQMYKFPSTELEFNMPNKKTAINDILARSMRNNVKAKNFVQMVMKSLQNVESLKQKKMNINRNATLSKLQKQTKKSKATINANTGHGARFVIGSNYNKLVNNLTTSNSSNNLYFIENGAEKRIPFLYLMLLDTLHDIFERLNKLDKTFLRDHIPILKPEIYSQSRRITGAEYDITIKIQLFSWILKLTTEELKSKQAIIEFFKHASRLMNATFVKRIWIIKETSLKETKDRLLEFILGLLNPKELTMKVGNFMKPYTVHRNRLHINTENLVNYLGNRKARRYYTIDATKYKLASGPLSSNKLKTNTVFREKQVVTVAQFFDSATSSFDNVRCLYIQRADWRMSTEIMKGYVTYFQGSMNQYTSLFSFYVHIPKNMHQERSNIITEPRNCIFEVTREILKNKTNSLNFMTRCFINYMGDVSRYKQLNKDLYYNQADGTIFIQRMTNISFPEITKFLSEFNKTKDKTKYMIAFDWKRFQDSFQMIFAKNYSYHYNINLHVITFDILAFIMGIKYGCSVILQYRGVYLVFSNDGKYSLNEAGAIMSLTQLLKSKVNYERNTTLQNFEEFSQIANEVKGKIA